MTGQAIAVPVAAVLDGGTHETRCERCLTALHVELPPLGDVLAEFVAQPADWPRLTAREASIARVLLGLRGEWVRAGALVRASYGTNFDAHPLRVNISRLRAKLPLGWRIENRTGSGYCLLGPGDAAGTDVPEPILLGRRCPDCGGRKWRTSRRCAWCQRKRIAAAA